MEIINIEKCAFEMMMARLSEFAQRVEKLYHKRNDKTLSQWLDNEDVCRMLNISKRTLQSYRDNGVLAYTQVDRKIYYSVAEVNRFINDKKIK
ncbi:MAG: helix-turn-helix domain-containing protein [Rikenellaceae bacterium]